MCMTNSSDETFKGHGINLKHRVTHRQLCSIVIEYRPHQHHPPILQPPGQLGGFG